MVETFDVRILERYEERKKIVRALNDFGISYRQAKVILNSDGIIERDVDEETAEEIVERLRGFLDEYDVTAKTEVIPTEDYRPTDLHGQILNEDTTEPIENGGLVMVSPDSDPQEPFGKAMIGDNGQFVLEGFIRLVEERFGEERPELVFTVRDGDQKLDVSHKLFDWQAFKRGGDRFEFLIYAEVPSQPTDQFVVEGTVTARSEEGSEPLTNARVRAFDRDLRSEQVVGETTTNSEGRYEISYTVANFNRAEKETADLIGRVYNNVDKVVAESETVFNASRTQTINFDIESRNALAVAEYDRLRSELSPILSDVPLAELTEEDIDFLSQETKISDRGGEFPAGRETIAILSKSSRLSRETDIRAEFFYALGRAEHELELETLFEKEDDILEEALYAAFEPNESFEPTGTILPVELREALETEFGQFQRLQSARERQTREEWEQREETVRFVDDETGEPLIGYTVRISEIGGDQQGDHENRVTDQDGKISFKYKVPPMRADGGADSPSFEIGVLDHNEEEFYQTEISTSGETEQVVRLSAPVPGQSSDVPIEELQERAQLELSEDTLTDVSGLSLVDIRDAGGVDNLDVSITSDGEDGAMLNTIANLSLLADPQTAKSLHKGGYTTQADIVDESPQTFFRTMSEQIDPEEALRVRAKADAQTAFLDSVVMDKRARWANRLASNQTDNGEFDGDLVAVAKDPELAAVFPTNCTCDDCESAVSPRAYLATLLDYVITYVREPWNTIEVGAEEFTITDLSELFHQPFGDLPAKCEHSEKSVRYIRLCVEILLDYLEDDVIQNLFTDNNDQFFVDPNQYRLSAYESLLLEWGTSRDELRNAKYDADDRQSVARRLGIDPVHVYSDDPADTPSLYLNSEAELDAADAISEGNLEHIFGLQALTELSDAGVHRRYPLGDVDESKIQQWRVEYLRDQWAEQDHPDDPYSMFLEADAASDATLTKTGDLPVIDPDVIGPDDFRNPVPGTDTDPNATFALWTKRREWVDEQLKELWNLPSDGIEPMLATVNSGFEYPHPPNTTRASPWTNWDETNWEGTATPEKLTSIGEALTGTETDTEAARDTIENELYLPVESFSRLVELIEKHNRAERNEKNDPVTKEELWEVGSILVQTRKASLYGVWVEEEETKGIQLDPTSFWISQREPTTGKWPTPPLTPNQQSPEPFIDPEQLDRKDLPEITAGRTAQTLYSERQVELEAYHERLRETYANTSSDDANPLDSVLTEVYGSRTDSWEEYLHAVSEEIEDSTVSNDKLDRLKLTKKQFETLASIRRQMTSETSGAPPSEENLDEVFSMLTSVWKRNEKYDQGTQGNWIDEEEQHGITSYWHALKARLPQWRSGQNARQQWQQALHTRSSYPLLDPDIVKDSTYFADSNDPSPAYELWEMRTDRLNGTTNDPDEWNVSDINSTVENLLSGSVGPKQGLMDLLNNTVGIDREGLTTIHERITRGEDISGRLEQLDLSIAVASYLLDIHENIKEGKPITETEWANVRAIMVQVWKRRTFGQWHREERAESVVLKPSQFALPDDDTGIEQSGEDPLRWRMDDRERRDWINTLENRRDQLSGVAIHVQEAVDATEEETLPLLRDALVEQINVDGTDTFEEKAEWATERLLIDTETDGCRETTRVSMATESLQTLLFALDTGIKGGGLEGLDLRITDNDFEKRWEWLSTYPKWKAAMGVYLYPENVLLPTLRRQTTPKFDQVASEVLSSRPFSSSDAADMAQNYSAYFEDICNLEPRAGCLAEGVVLSGSPQQGEDTTYLAYVFARGVTGSYYYKSFDPTMKNPTESRTFWKKIIPFEDMKGSTEELYGAITYQNTLYLFLRKKDGDEEKIGFFQYDVQSDGWSTFKGIKIPDSIDLEINENTVIDIVQTQGTDLRSPDLFIQNRTSSGHNMGHTAYLSFDTDGDFSSKNDISDVPELFSRSISSAVYKNGHLYIFWGPWNPVINIIFRRPENGTELTRSNIGTTFQGKAVPNYGNENVLIFDINEQMFAIELEGDYPDIDTYDLTNSPNPIDTIQCNNTKIGLSTEDGYNLDNGVYIAKSIHNQEMQFFRLHKQTSGKYSFVDMATINPVVSENTDNQWRFGVSSVDNIDEESTFFQSPLEDLEQASKAIFNHNQSLSRQANQTYVEEAFFHIPLLMARQLMQSGNYDEALNWFRTIYDYTRPTERKIWYGLNLAEGDSGNLSPGIGWLTDPINPHSIADSRPNTGTKYTQFTLFSIIRCLLDYADTEFSRDTGEAIAQARTLYEIALDLLSTSELKQLEDPCETLLIELEKEVPKRHEFDPNRQDWRDITGTIGDISDYGERLRAKEEIETIMQIDELSLHDRFKRIHVALNEVTGEYAETQPQSRSLREVVDEDVSARGKVHTELLSNKNTARAVWQTGDIGNKLAVVEKQDGSDGTLPPLESDGGTAYEYRGWFLPEIDVVQVPMDFCIPENPILKSLRRHANLNLEKIRTCRNIAGMQRELEPYAAPTGVESAVPTLSNGQIVLPTPRIQPTDYRYDTLIERTKELVNLAQQIETQFFSAIEKSVREEYKLLKSQQDIELARAGVRLQNLRLTEAHNSVDLAELQRERAKIQEKYYIDLVNEGLIGLEKTAIGFMIATAELHTSAAAFWGGDSVWETAKAVATFGLLGDSTGSAAKTATSLAAASSTTAQIFNTYASYARREQRWNHQKRLANQDIHIASQQIQLAQDHVDIVSQQREIAELETEHAEDIVNFHENKFTNEALYQWMSNILEGVYRYFLQQAASMARLAQNQLAFQRQEPPLQVIESDYWRAPTTGQSISVGNEDESPDRRGLTGSARLLQDIYQLDQHAFETDERKLHVEKTMSIGQLDPIALQEFRETGILSFATLMEQFDRDHPGQYLRLIEDVDVRAIALTPPTDGIKATLRTSGTSRVVIGDDIFRKRTIRRQPESVVLSASQQEGENRFRLQADQGEMLRPFENMGVESEWELRMPKAANPFDYDTIADVLFTMKYTALESYDYRQQVIEELDPRQSVDRAFSLENEFADQWYDLHNPDQVADPMTVTFETTDEEFPPNLAEQEIEQLQLYFIGPEGEELEDIEVTVQFSEQGSDGSTGGEAVPIEGLIRTPIAGSWTTILGEKPAGQWTLKLPDSRAVRQLFEDELIKDILFIVTVSGKSPDWPE